MFILLSILVGCRQEQLQDCLLQEEPSTCMQKHIEESAEKQHLEKQCQAIAEQKWRGECHFLIADISGAIGAEAKRLCSLATPFVEDCLRHAAARDVEQNLYPILENKNAKPLKVMPRIYGIVQNYLQSEIGESMARDMVLRHYATGLRPPFTRASCQGMPPDMCAQLYIIASLGSNQQWTGEENWFQHCGKRVDATLAQSFSWMIFTADAQEIVQRSFQQLCQAKPAAN